MCNQGWNTEEQEEHSRPSFVSHALLTFGLANSLLWGFPLPCQVYLCLWSLPKLLIACSAHLYSSHTMSDDVAKCPVGA